MKNTQKKKKIEGRLGVVYIITGILIMTSAAAPLGAAFNLNQFVSGNRLSYTFEFLEPTLQSSDDAYTTLSQEGCLTIGYQAGEPALPVKVISLLLPPNKTVARINVLGTPLPMDCAGMQLIEKPLMPQQRSIPIGEQPTGFAINTQTYTTDAFYPSARYMEYSVGYSHGYPILSVSLNPVQYNPVSGTLQYYQKMTLTVTLQDTSANRFYRNTIEDQNYVSRLVSNPEVMNWYSQDGLPTFDYPGGLCDASDHYDYVIITTTQNGLDYWDTTSTTPYNWESLMEYHAGEGLSCTLVTKQDILACPDYYNATPLFNDSQARIREFCRDAYQDWETQYILIAGDSDTMPARQMYYAYEGNVDADIYWSNLDNSFNADNDNRWGEESDSGFDLYAELAIGRVTCDIPQDVSNWLTKSFYYADSTDGDYLDNTGFYGGNTGWDCQGDDFVDYSAIKGTDDWLGPDPDDPGEFPTWVGFQYGFETWNQVNVGNEYNLSVRWTAEPPNPGWQGGSDSAAINGFRTAINEDKVTIISGIAHANNQMSLDVYDDDWANLYHNTKPFFIHDYGCHCGDFDDGDDGIIETMLFHSDVELAFGCVYNTGYGWGQFESTNSSSAFQAKAFWDYFLDTENNSGAFSNWQIGVAHSWSKDQMAPMINWDFSYGTWRGIIECCLLFGDPAQMLKSPHPSQAPQKPSKPVGQSLGIWNVEYTYTSQTSDPDNDQIYYLFDWGDGSTSGWLGPYPSGTTGVGTHTWTELGTYSVKVKARDVWGAGSYWSDALDVTITDNNLPDIPEITGPGEGKPGNPYLYNFVSDDLDGHTISYYVDWGDNTSSGWVGPYVAGTMIHLTHAWDEEGTYTIKAKAKDVMDGESDWGTLSVVMPLDVSFESMTQQLFSNILFDQRLII
jgi:hypothetical protein